MRGRIDRLSVLKKSLEAEFKGEFEEEEKILELMDVLIEKATIRYLDKWMEYCRRRRYE